MQEEHKEEGNPLEENKPEILSEMERAEASLNTKEEKSKDPDIFKKEIEKEVSQNDKSIMGDRTMYCTICNKQIEKYGRRKEDFKKSGWVFCPKHGWIKEGIHDKEIASEQPLRFSIEEVTEKQGEEEISSDKKESEMLRESEKPEISPRLEEKQLETDLFIERETKTADLPIGERNIVRNKSTSIGIIISAIFVTVLVSLIFGYFAWKSSSDKFLEIKSLKALVQNERLTKQVQSQASPPPQESVLAEKFPEEVKSQTSTPGQEAVPQSEKTETIEKAKIKPSQSQNPLQAIFTVQAGAFSDVSYAESLKKRLEKKGYHTYITSSKSKGGGMLYKVWMGKFSNRKTAENLSAKITATEGVQTFVTLWKKQ
jgi:cell division protein FtsN